MFAELKCADVHVPTTCADTQHDSSQLPSTMRASQTNTRRHLGMASCTPSGNDATIRLKENHILLLPKIQTTPTPCMTSRPSPSKTHSSIEGTCKHRRSRHVDELG